MGTPAKTYIVETKAQRGLIDYDNDGWLISIVNGLTFNAPDGMKLRPTPRCFITTMTERLLTKAGAGDQRSLGLA
jgi:hypothetical protein